MIKQVEGYDHLPFYLSSRGVAAILLGLFAILNLLAIATKYVELTAFVDVVILVILAIFVYSGSRFAMVMALIYWTAARIVGFRSALVGKDLNEATLLSVATVLLFWCLGIFIFYRALRVALVRDRLYRGGEISQEGHYCTKCGHVLPADASFCPQCGCDQKHHLETAAQKKHAYVVTTEDGARYVIDLRKARHAGRILEKGSTAHDPRTGEEVDIEDISRIIPQAVRGHQLQFVFSSLTVVLLAVFLVVHVFDLSLKPKEYDARSLAAKFNDSVVLIQSDSSSGSGVIMGSDGLILTNRHVVTGAGPYKVKLNDGRYFPVTTVIPHDQYDLAVVSIPATNLKAVDIKCQPQHDVGQKVIAIGNPSTPDAVILEKTVTEGVISALRPKGDIYDIQFDATITHGSSGGLLVNSYGEAIGITTKGYKGINFNFAIPIEYAREFMIEGRECVKRVDVAGQKLNYSMAEKQYKQIIPILANTYSEMLQESLTKPHFKLTGKVIDESTFPDSLLLQGNSIQTGKGRKSASACEQQNVYMIVFNPELAGFQRPYYQGTHCCYDVTSVTDNYGTTYPIYRFVDCINETLHHQIKVVLESKVEALMNIEQEKGLVPLRSSDYSDGQATVLRYYEAIKSREPALSLEHIIPEKRNRGAFTLRNYQSYSEKISDGPYVYSLFPDDKGGFFALVSEKTDAVTASISLIRFKTENKAGSWYISKIVPVSTVKR